MNNSIYSPFLSEGFLSDRCTEVSITEASVEAQPYGTTITTVTFHESESICCISVEPLHEEHFDLDWEKTKHCGVLVISLITLTYFFVLMQNTSSIFSCSEKWKFPRWAAILIVVCCAIGTLFQTIAARSINIITIPFKLTMAQKSLLEAIEEHLLSHEKLDKLKKELFTQLEGLDDSEEHLQKLRELEKIQDDLMVLISSEEYESMQVTLYEKLKGILTPYLSEWPSKFLSATACFISAAFCLYPDWIFSIFSTDRTNFIYQLQILSTRYQVQLHLSPKFETKYHDMSILTNTSNILAYSPCYHDTQNAPVPSHSLKRYICSSEYRQWINEDVGRIGSLLSMIGYYIFPNFFLMMMPIIATLLQGISSLDDTLRAFGVNCDNQPYARLSIVVIGLLLPGLAKAYVTNEIKAPIAIERWNVIFDRITHLFSSSEKEKVIPKRKFLNDLHSFFFDSEISLYKKNHMAQYYFIPLFSYILSFVVFILTVDYYGGLGLLFSASGLIYVLTTLRYFTGYFPIPNVNDYNVAWYASICALNFISVVLLNAVFNQGWDFIEKSNKQIAIFKGKIDEKIKTNVIEDIETGPVPANNVTNQYSFSSIALIIFTLLDSIAAFYTSTTGATKTQTTINSLSHNFLKPLNGWFPIVVGATLFLSQFNYSYVLYSRDGKLWRIFSEMYLPECLKNALGIQSIARPAINGYMQAPINTAYQNKKVIINQLRQQYQNSRQKVLTCSSSSHFSNVYSLLKKSDSVPELKSY